MKSIYLILSLFLAIPAFACITNYPYEYLAQNSDFIIVGEIEKMDYDLPHEAPYEDMHYSLAYVRVDELLKGTPNLKENKYFTFRVASEKDGSTTATIFWDKGMKGTWFFMREDDSETWMTTFLKPIDLAEKVKTELSLSPKRRFGKTFYIPQPKIGGSWPDKISDEITLFQLVTYHNLYAEAGRSNFRLSLDEDLDPNIKIKRIDYDQTVIEFLRDISDQHGQLDFDFGDYQILLFERKGADPDGCINSVTSLRDSTQ